MQRNWHDWQLPSNDNNNNNNYIVGEQSKIMEKKRKFKHEDGRMVTRNPRQR